MTVSLSNLQVVGTLSGTKKENSNVDAVSYSKSISFTEGTGNDQVDDFWYQSGTLSSGGSTEFNLTALTRTLLNNSLTQNFANIKGFYIENTATGVDQYFTITATGSQPFTTLFNGESGNLKVNEKGCLIMSNSISGWDVGSGSTDTIQLNDGGLAATYRIALLGVLA